MVRADGNVEFFDFDFDDEPKRFKMYRNDTFIFEATPDIPIDLAARVAQFARADIGNGDVEPIFQLFDELLLDESAKEFRRRRKDPKYPIGARVVLRVLPWLLEAYGLRPQEPSPDSSTPSPDDDGISLTAGAALEASIPSDFD